MSNHYYSTSYPLRNPLCTSINNLKTTPKNLEEEILRSYYMIIPTTILQMPYIQAKVIQTTNMRNILLHKQPLIRGRFLQNTSRHWQPELTTIASFSVFLDRLRLSSLPQGDRNNRWGTLWSLVTPVLQESRIPLMIRRRLPECPHSPLAILLMSLQVHNEFRWFMLKYFSKSHD